MANTITKIDAMNNVIETRLIDLKQDLMAHKGDAENNQRVADLMYSLPDKVAGEDVPGVAGDLLQDMNQSFADAVDECEALSNGGDEIGASEDKVPQAKVLADRSNKQQSPFQKHAYIETDGDTGDLKPVTSDTLLSVINGNL